MPRMGICFKNEHGHFLKDMGDYGVLEWSENPSDAKLFDTEYANELAAFFGHCLFIGIIRVSMRRAILIETATGYFVRDGREVRKCRTLKKA